LRIDNGSGRVSFINSSEGKVVVEYSKQGDTMLILGIDPYNESDGFLNTIKNAPEASVFDTGKIDARLKVVEEIRDTLIEFYSWYNKNFNTAEDAHNTGAHDGNTVKYWVDKFLKEKTFNSLKENQKTISYHELETNFNEAMEVISETAKKEFNGWTYSGILRCKDMLKDLLERFKPKA